MGRAKPDAPRPNFTGKKHLTLYERFANDTVQRFGDEPALLQRKANLLPAHRYSAEQYAALQIEDPAGLIAKATEDELRKHWREFQLRFNTSYVGKGKIEEGDVPFNRAENMRNLWARNPLDPTVYPQTYDSRSPHRAYALGRPAIRPKQWFRQPSDELSLMHVVSAEHIRLSTLLKEICKGTAGFINAWGAKTLCDAHDDYSARIRKLLAALPGERPAKVRELIGMYSLLYMYESWKPFNLENLPKVRNFVGIVCAPGTVDDSSDPRKTLHRHGVSILRPVPREQLANDPTAVAAWKDDNFTLDWVKQQRQEKLGALLPQHLVQANAVSQYAKTAAQQRAGNLLSSKRRKAKRNKVENEFKAYNKRDIDFDKPMDYDLYRRMQFDKRITAAKFRLSAEAAHPVVASSSSSSAILPGVARPEVRQGHRVYGGVPEGLAGHLPWPEMQEKLQDELGVPARPDVRPAQLHQLPPRAQRPPPQAQQRPPPPKPQQLPPPPQPQQPKPKPKPAPLPASPPQQQQDDVDMDAYFDARMSSVMQAAQAPPALPPPAPQATQPHYVRWVRELQEQGKLPKPKSPERPQPPQQPQQPQ
ncbi:hypothetical protein CALCODRAFT_488978 [Calocera cornea HHB12733]|uniref:Uncharacterized protein n=1 Tax=Calocera cornea HHB12733 TaxID=1353952 RepID=A0A165C0U6_9BASI|nr:hypothetical protein CALCODRAFT_488978 [Calocera cornea HHB12733]